MKNFKHTAGSRSIALIGASILSNSSPVLAQAENRFTDQQRVGYLGRTSRSMMARDVLDRLRESDEARQVSNTADRVLMWHEVLLDAVALDHTPDPDTDVVDFVQGGPTRTSRALAMTQIAVFDALNSFELDYGAYNDIGASDSTSASLDAAVAYAAHGVLIELYPDQIERLDAVLLTDLQQIDANDALIDGGQLVGQGAAQAMIDVRASYNSFDFEPDFGAGGRVADGNRTWFDTAVNSAAQHQTAWMPDPLTPEFSADYSLALGAFWGGVTPFALGNGDRYRVPPPPEPGTQVYVDGYQLTQSIGASADTSGSGSTAETRFIGNCWGYDATPLLGVPPRLYNQIAVQLALDGGLTDATNVARYLAMVNTALADAGIAAWDSKYFYDYARPVTGIRVDDRVDATMENPDWKPVGVSVINTDEAITPTPPFPSYPSGHATFGGALFEVLRGFFGNATAFTFVSDEYNGEGVDPLGVERPLVPVRYATLQEAQEENGISRIYNGVHWPWDNDEGQALGVRIGQHISGQRAFQPVDG